MDILGNLIVDKSELSDFIKYNERIGFKHYGRVLDVDLQMMYLEN